jgi:tetratricopeptide (TPR) repeat protein
MEQAGQDIANNRFQKAIRTLEPLISTEAARKETPRAAYMAGIAYYMLNDYEKAVELLTNREELREADKEVAAFHFGAAAYALQKYREAVAALKPLVDMSADDILNPELRPYAIMTVARSYVGEAEQLSRENPAAAKERAKLAIPIIDKLMAEDTEGALTEEANTVKAIALTLSDQLLQAEALLNSLMDDPDSQMSESEINNMLAFILSKRYRQLLAEFKEDEAAQVIEKTKSIYQKLLQSDDLSIVNQSAFELANLELASNNQEEAFRAFRAIRSKSEIVESLEIKLEKLRSQIQSVRGDVKKIQSLQKQIRKAEQKLQEAQSRSDLALDALVRTADTYLQMGDYDEARTVYRYVAPFMEEERKAAIEGQVIVSLALQGQVEQAETAFQAFKAANPNNEIAQSIPFLIGIALLQQEKYQEAIDQFNRNMKEYPNSPINDQIPSRMATAYRGLAAQAGSEEDVTKFMNQAAQTLRDFIKNASDGKIKVPKASIEDAELQLSQTLAGQNKNEEAMTILDRVSSSASTSEIKETASWTRAGLLEKMRKTDEAVKAYNDFSKEFSASDRADDAAFKAAFLLEAGGKNDEARQSYSAFIENYSTSPLVEAAYTQIWKTYKTEKNYDEMIKAQDRLVSALPKSGAAIGALFDRAQTFSGSSDEAIKAQAPEIINSLVEKIKGFKGEVSESEYLKYQRYANYGLVLFADIRRNEISQLGADFASLENEADKEKYAALHAEVVELMKRALQEFPHPDMLTHNFSRIVGSMVSLAEIGKGDIDDDADFFSALAGAARDEQLKAHALLARADIYFNAGRTTESQPLYKLAFQEVNEPTAISVRQYERYGDQLLEAKNWDELATIADKLQGAWGGNRRKAVSDLANSTALFYKAKVAEAKNSGNAASLYKQIKDQYPNTPKATQVDYGLAMSKIRAGNYDEGIGELSEITRSPRAPNELKARSLIDIALALEEMADAGKTSKHAMRGPTKIPEMDMAVNNLQRVEVYFPDLKNLVAEALYRAVGMRKKQGQNEEANQIRLNLITNYPTTEWAGKLR